MQLEPSTRLVQELFTKAVCHIHGATHSHRTGLLSVQSSNGLGHCSIVTSFK